MININPVITCYNHIAVPAGDLQISIPFVDVKGCWVIILVPFFSFSIISQDIDYEDYQRWCEYILYRDLVRLGYARISHGGLSDTEVQLGRFKVPDDPKNFTDNNAVTTTREDVEENMRFSEK